MSVKQLASISADAEDSQFRFRDLLVHWPILVGLLIVGIPTIIRLGNEVWSTELGAHGPIVLATGLWLFSRTLPDMHARTQTTSQWLLWPGLLVAMGLYVFGRAFDLISIEAAGLYGIAMMSVVLLFGLPAILANLFPFIYLAFLIPPPGWVIDAVTAPLREFVSVVATKFVAILGYPIVNEGISITIAQYQLLVEDACSGMNSLFGLIAISLFYVYIVHKSSWIHSLILLIAIIPIAILANIIRVIILILITYHYGDAVAQGFLHVTAGLVLFVISLLLIFALDMVLRKFTSLRGSEGEG